MLVGIVNKIIVLNRIVKQIIILLGFMDEGEEMHMQMIEPDFWKGRGRYSKQAMSRKTIDQSPILIPDGAAVKAAGE